MKKRKILLLISPLITFMAIAMLFNIPFAVASFIDYFTVDTNQDSFIDTTTQNFICYPLEDSNNNNYCAIGWGKTIEESTGSLTIPQTVTKGTGNEAITYQVKAIAECGFRFCEFSSISFAGNNVEEIKSEAFYSCQNITTFTMPEKCVHGVGPSSFMDCRSLTKVDMTNTISYINTQVQNDNTFLANNPYVIGDHAFASCVKLKGFTFPTNLTEIGESAFHKCTQIFGFFLPSNNLVNTISIGKYAFADCTNLVVIHMEKNISYIDSYAFAQCNKLKIYYQGNPSENGDPMQNFDANFRKKHVATDRTDAYADYVPMDTNVSEMSMDDDHPGLIYVKQPGPILYNGKTNSTLVIDPSTDEYVTIFQWNTPSVESDDYDDANDILTIPDTIAGCPVKRIGEQAFFRGRADNTPLKGVVFNPSLVQICKEAFKECYQLATLDFSDCVALREIGPNAFNPDGDQNHNNDAFTGTLSLPNSLYYIGNNAFYKFRKATGLQLFDDTKTPYLKFIGNSAFQYFGYNVTSNLRGTWDLLLPYSLNDGAVFEAVPDTRPADDGWMAVGTKAFDHSYILRSVTMQYHPNKPQTGKTQSEKTTNNRTGFGVQCFANIPKLLRFKANYTMMRLGQGCFEYCPNLKEIFMSAYLRSGEKDAFTWGWGEGRSIFYTGTDPDSKDKDGNFNGSDEYRDLVIYVDEATAPVRKARQQKYYMWNSDPRTYPNEYMTSADEYNYSTYADNQNNPSHLIRERLFGRQVVPVYYGVNFHTAGTVQYVNLTTGVRSNTPPTDYSNCAALLLKNNKYIVTKCYGSVGLGTIDMTTWSLDKDIIQIGASSFATLTNGTYPAKKIILPSTVESIRDRAFYSVNSDGVNIVTYKNGGAEVTDTGADAKTNICFLPNSVVRVEDFAFYNNNFEKVLLNPALNMLGNTVFTSTKTKTATIESFGVDGSSSYFTYDGQSMYDTSTGTLLYHSAKGNGALNLSSLNINAIGARALANTTYTSIQLPTTVSRIYGAAFAGNAGLTSVTGLVGLEYISGDPDGTYTDAYNTDANFTLHNLAPGDFSSDYHWTNQFGTGQNATGSLGVYIDSNVATRPIYYRWVDTFGAFANCTSLSNFDLTSCTNIKKIGYGAFEGCSNLETMTNGTTTYTYYKYEDFNGLTDDNASTMLNAADAPKVQITKGVCDLSEATDMTYLGKDAFYGCSKLKYFHLPLVYGDDLDKNTQSGFHLGLDADDKGTWYDNSPSVGLGSKKSVFEKTGVSDGAVLVGETAKYACADHATGNNGNYLTTTSLVGAGIDDYDKTKYYIDRYRTEFLYPNKTYFYVRDEQYFTEDTCANVTGNSVKYWIQIGSTSDHKYLLFDSRENLKTYYGI